MKKKVLVVLVAVGLISIFWMGVVWAQHPADWMVKEDGKDALVHEKLVERAIRPFEANIPTQGANDDNGWFCNGPGHASGALYIMVKEGEWYRAKGLAGEDFHPVQLPPNYDYTDANKVRWARLEFVPGVNIPKRILPKWLKLRGGDPTRPCINTREGGR